MLSRFSYIEQNAQKKRVLYEGTSVIYQGMPVCYNYDTTDNIDGYDAVDGAGSTTDEGHQNEGKYVRVEDPAADNLMHFAGVVAGTEHEGETGTGEKWLEIYIPNGAIVPVRCDVDTSVGITLLAITVDSQEFGQPIEGTSRVVALAMETETTLDSGTTGITLAKLDNHMSIYQDLDGTPLSIGAGTANHVVNSINVTSAQTSGRFSALHIYSKLTAGGATAHHGLAFYAVGEVSATPATPNHIAAASIRLYISGGTPDEYLTGLKVTVKEDTAVAMTSAKNVSVLNLALQVTHDVKAHGLSWMYLEDNSTQHADNFIRAKYLTDLPATVFTGTTAGLANDGSAYGIKVYLLHEGITEWYIPIVNTLA